MKSTALVSLDCTDGTARRYLRVHDNKPRETGRLVIDDWKTFSRDPDVDWEAFGGMLRDWRGAYTPPEEDGPRPTPPLRTAQTARAA